MSSNFDHSIFYPGQLERTILHTFIRAGNLKRWLARPDCLALIRACKELFDRAYSMDPTQDADADDAAQHMQVRSPDDLRPLIEYPTISLRARHSHNGISYTRSSTHVGNSLVYYHPRGDETLEPVPGSIKYIYLPPHGAVTFVVQCQLHVALGTHDPF